MKDLYVSTNAGVHMIPGRTDGAVYINASGNLLLHLDSVIIAAYTGGREVQTLQNVQYVRGGVTAIAAWKRWVCEQINVSRLGSIEVDEEELRAIAAVSISNAYLGVGALYEMARDAAKNLSDQLRPDASHLAKTWSNRIYTSAPDVAVQVRATKALAAKVSDAKRGTASGE